LPSLRVVTARDVTPAQLLRWGSGLLAQDLGTATLVLAELSEGAVLLGRHQRAASAIDATKVGGLRLARRLGGGKAIVVAPGTLGVLLAVPPGSGLGTHVAPDRVLNRHVRGLLRGLGSAFYFGRDFVAAEKRQIAAVSQDGAPGGTQLFEAYVATTAPLGLPAAWSKYPQHGDARAHGPAHTSLAELGRKYAFTEVAAQVATGYAHATGAWLQATDEEALVEGDAPGPDVAEDDEGWSWSGVADVPIGFLEAQARIAEGKLEAARLRGDFIAPTFVVRALEASLEGCRLELAAVAAQVDAAFTLPGAAMVGVTQLRIVADAFLACADAAG
jgi:hypothetical protein